MATKSKQRTPQKQDDPEQSKRFIEAAKKAEADESEEGARRAFKKVASRPSGKRSKRPSSQC
jgi:hypothetical protein